MISLTCKFFNISVVILLLLSKAYTQNTTVKNKIEAVVNGDIVTHYDLEHTTRIIAFLNQINITADNVKDIKQTAFLKLLDDVLKLQKAHSVGIRIRNSDVKRAYRDIAKKNNTTVDNFKQELINNRIDTALFDQHLMAATAWRKYVLSELVAKVKIDTQDIDAEMGRMMQEVSNPMVRIAEIFLPVEHDKQEDHFINFAWELWEKVQNGSDFPKIAREVSRGPSARRGGDIGWVNINTLQKPLDIIAMQLQKGEVSEPVITENGIYIILLIDRQLPNQELKNILSGQQEQFISQIETNNSKKEWIDFVIIAPDIKINERKKQSNLLANMPNDIDILNICQEKPNTHPDNQDITFEYFNNQQRSKLNSKIRKMLSSLTLHQLSQINEISDTYVRLIICKRSLSDPSIAAKQADDDKKELSQLEQERQKTLSKLRNEQLNTLAAQALIDLRKSAFIDYR